MRSTLLSVLYYEGISSSESENKGWFFGALLYNSLTVPNVLSFFIVFQK